MWGFGWGGDLVGMLVWELSLCIHSIRSQIYSERGEIQLASMHGNGGRVGAAAERDRLLLNEEGDSFC